MGPPGGLRQEVLCLFKRPRLLPVLLETSLSVDGFLSLPESHGLLEGVGVFHNRNGLPIVIHLFKVAGRNIPTIQQHVLLAR